ncbi:multifunctional cyclase-dehydratase-3-O-methyl transferase TcmN [Methyloglobulus morosus KoM1]|uniref:Multifunctional cyclase-dehydratase-3-O-methyl transferase TcmN n=1 Tax=Methyloglobulus morosus KoM1 TaxID=1116472 RepID=V5BYW4_9GAMM|nr:methyltransferase [Methyloglobulus morosus]ESS71447.1 multifunctional cyclase-dehydratase-3-O-methyl transferase TcmN [Methyloglobulus morosus KoM1]
MTFQKNSASVYLFTILVKFVVWLQAIPHKLTPPPFRLLQIGSAFWQSRALYVATQLNIASLLGDGQLTADAIAEQVLAKPDAIYRLLRMLAAMGIFEEVSSHVFKNNTLSAYLRDDQPKNVRAMVLMHNSMEMSKPWYEQLDHGIQSGEVPFQLSHGKDLYAYMDNHAEFDALFSRAMDSVEALTGNSFATDFNWGAFNRIIDVGGSKGSKSLAILKQYPHLAALVFDREQVVKTAAAYWNEKKPSDVLSRITYQAGDLLESVPAAKDDKDIYFLSAVLHGFDDAECLQVLGNLVIAIADTGARIALMELVVPELKADIASATFDMQMFMATRGRERTLAEWTNLFDQSGLALEELIGLKSIGKIMVLRQK